MTVPLEEKLDKGQVEYFSEGISILFQEPEINFGDHGEKAIVNFPNHSPMIELEIADIDAKNFSLFAHYIWKSSILMSKLLLAAPSIVAGKRVLELGAGVGIPSIVALRLGAMVISSDYPDENLISRLKFNLQQNHCGDYQVIGHEWGEEETISLLLNQGQFDVILMADTLWMSHQHHNLLKDLQKLLKPKGIIFGVAGLHSGKTTFESFFTKSASYGFSWTWEARRIPIGAGFCEEKEWDLVKDEGEITDDPRERLRFLYTFKMWFKSELSRLDSL